MYGVNCEQHGGDKTGRFGKKHRAHPAKKRRDGCRKWQFRLLNAINLIISFWCDKSRRFIRIEALRHENIKDIKMSL